MRYYALLFVPNVRADRDTLFPYTLTGMGSARSCAIATTSIMNIAVTVSVRNFVGASEHRAFHFYCVNFDFWFLIGYFHCTIKNSGYKSTTFLLPLQFFNHFLA